MTERWRSELTRLRRVGLPGDLWDRVGDGPRLEPAPEPAGKRWIAGVLAVAVFAAAAVVAIRAFLPADSSGPEPGTLSGPAVTTVPPRGQASAAFLMDGRPVFVVHHEGGAVSVIDAFSTHRPWGFEELVGWCPSIRQFVEWAHGAVYDEDGRYLAGPAASGLQTFAFDVVSSDADGDPAAIRVGAIRPGAPRGRHRQPSTLCQGTQDVAVGHTIDGFRIFDTPAAVAAAAPKGWAAVRATLLVSEDGSVQLCAHVEGERCDEGVPVSGIDGAGLMANLLRSGPRTAYTERDLWLVRSRDGLVEDLARGDTLTVVGNDTAGEAVGCGAAPLPDTQGLLYAVDGTGPDDVWAVGDAASPGTAPFLHFDGSEWTVQEDPGVGSVIVDVAPLSASDVWVLGKLTAHFDGSRWTTFDLPLPVAAYQDPMPAAIAAVAPDDVWVVGSSFSDEAGSRGLIQHWDGVTWEIVPSPADDAPWKSQLWGVDAASATDVWAVGIRSGPGSPDRLRHGLTMHWDGTAWTLVETPVDVIGPISDVAVDGEGGAWAVGGNTVLRWDGTAWTALDPGTGVTPLAGVDAVSSEDAWAVSAFAGEAGWKSSIRRWDGTAWRHVRAGPDDTVLMGVVAFGDDGWAVGGSLDGDVARVAAERLCP